MTIEFLGYRDERECKDLNREYNDVIFSHTRKNRRNKSKPDIKVFEVIRKEEIVHKVAKWNIKDYHDLFTNKFDFLQR